MLEWTPCRHSLGFITRIYHPPATILTQWGVEDDDTTTTARHGHDSEPVSVHSIIHVSTPPSKSLSDKDLAMNHWKAFPNPS